MKILLARVLYIYSTLFRVKQQTCCCGANSVSEADNIPGLGSGAICCQWLNIAA